jgi:hypothetical protein
MTSAVRLRAYWSAIVRCSQRERACAAKAAGVASVTEELTAKPVA